MAVLVTRRINEEFGLDPTDETCEPDMGHVEGGVSVSSSTVRWPPQAPGIGPGPASSRKPRPKIFNTSPLWKNGVGAEESAPSPDPAELRESLLLQVGSLGHIPRSGVASHEIGSMGLEHRLAFILSLVDGVSTVGEVVEACGLEELEALSLLCQLEEQGLVAFFRSRS